MIVEIVVPAVTSAVGALVARYAANRVVRDPPPSLIRVNVDGKNVPAVLGAGVLAGTAVGAVLVLLYIAFGYQQVGAVARPGAGVDVALEVRPFILGWLALVAVCPLFAAGLWDDLRGDEQPRGFGGHLGAFRGGALTGGVVKLMAGVAVGFLAVWSIAESITFHPLAILMAAAIALSANLVNLLDRAPARAAKMFLLLAVPLALADPEYRIIGAAVIGAACALLPLDLSARGMLGDAGANPLGAMAGLGLVLVVPGTYFWMGALVAILLALNLASERWSFSEIIERIPWLARLDRLGRK